jgi:NHL repeat
MEPLLVSGTRNRAEETDPSAWRARHDSWRCGWTPSLSVLFACVLSTTFVLALSAGVARAEAPKLVPDGQLESAEALGVAVDQSTNDVYAAAVFSQTPTGEFVTARVNKFDASGNLLSPPSPFGEAVTYSGTAVNPVNGDVYVLGEAALFGPASVFTYDPASGAPAPLPSFSVPGSRNFFRDIFTVVGIATDSAGNVYVPVVAENEVLEYDPATCPAVPKPCVPLKTFTGGSGAGALKGPTGVAVDPAGNVWVADTGNSRIVELNQKDEQLTEIRSEGVGSVAVDAHGDVFAIVSNSADFCGKIKPPCSHLVEYSSTGAQLADLGAGSIGAAQFSPAGERSAEPDMVAVSDSSGVVYVTEAVFTPPAGGGSGRVLKFRPPVAPALEGETALEVGVSEAKLGAVVNPGGLSASYRFEYDTREYKEGEGHHGVSVPFPEGDTGAGFTSRTVWAGASGLAPGTTYHYRAVVTGALGEPLVGNDQTFTTETAAQAACPNEQFRTGFSAALPDCRSYELVTPPNKHSAQPDKNEGGNGGGQLKLDETLQSNFAAADGSRLSFKAQDVRPGSPSAGESYVATRGPGGWSEENMFPLTNYYGYKCPEEALHLSGYSEDLAKAIILVESGGGQPCGVEPELIKGEPRGSENLFVRDNTTGSYQLLNGPQEGVVGFVPESPTLLGESGDFSRIVFAEEAKLTPDAPAGVKNVYEWSAGHVHLATVLENGTGVAGSFVGISTDGSRVFFIAAGALYARVDGTETVQLDASQAGGIGGGGSFQTASQDGSVVFFTDDVSAGLTADTFPGSGTNLYRFDANAPAGQRLTDITPVANAVAPVVSGVSKDGSMVFFTDDASAELTSDTKSNSGTNLYRYAAGQLIDLTPAAQAEVQGVLGVSEDGSSVYFKAAGVLTSQPNQHGETAQGGQPNMYVSRGGAPAFIAINGPVIAINGPGRFRLSANGAFFAFESEQSLTGYDNVSQSTGQPADELYLYDAVANSLACASCNPSGQPPTAGGAGAGGREGGGFEDPAQGRAPHNLAENGRLFFDSAEGLLPADSNGGGGCSHASGYPACDDVYEFEPPGVGSCSEPAGCLYLISTGTGTSETFFIDASSSGNDVFIREYQKLVPRDAQDGAPSLYDVRVDGGLPEPPPPPPCTTADACRTAPAPQPGIFGAPASQTFSGLGNLAPPPTTKPKTLTNAQKLAKALSSCRAKYKHSKRRRATCEKQAHKKYPTKTTASKAKRARKTNHKGSE